MEGKNSRLRKKLKWKYMFSARNLRAAALAACIILSAGIAAFGITKVINGGWGKETFDDGTEKISDDGTKTTSDDGTEKTSSVIEEETATASVIAVGDNLYHMNMIEAGASETGNWNYDFLYEHVLDEIQSADVAIVDQETVLTKDHEAVEAYPTFLTPVEAADALVKAGFDVVYSATNHADDTGPDAILETVAYWKTNYPEITFLGLHDSAEDASVIRVREVNGIKIAFINYTFGTNMAILEGMEDYMIDELSEGSEQVSQMIQKAKTMSDCVIFIAHWGIEDDTAPSEYQKQWASFLLKQGVNVVIGGHPHVLQPYGRFSDDKGNEAVIFYSLGNFVSNMNYLPEVVEGMASFTIKKTVRNGQTSVKILNETVKPMIMHYDYNRQNPAVYMLKDYTEDLAEVHGSATYIQEWAVTLENMHTLFDEIMSGKAELSTGTDLLNKHFDWDGNIY